MRFKTQNDRFTAVRMRFTVLCMRTVHGIIVETGVGKETQLKEIANVLSLFFESHPVPCAAEFNFASGILWIFFLLFFISLSFYSTTEICTPDHVALTAALHLNCTSFWLKEKIKL